MMVLGFVVERFDLFAHGAQAAAAHGPSLHNLRPGELAGLALMVAGIAVVGVAIARFLTTTREIDDQTLNRGPGEKLDVAVGVLLFLIGAALLGYLVFNVLVR
jgi:uncharacterized membrane protein YidH (DUF202 family)